MKHAEHLLARQARDAVEAHGIRDLDGLSDVKVLEWLRSTPLDVLVKFTTSLLGFDAAAGAAAGATKVLADALRPIEPEPLIGKRTRALYLRILRETPPEPHERSEVSK